MTDRQAALAMREAAVAVLQKRREIVQENLQFFASLGNEVETAHAAQAIEMFDEAITEMSALHLPDEPAVGDDAEDECGPLGDTVGEQIMSRLGYDLQRGFVIRIVNAINASIPAPTIDVMALFHVYQDAKESWYSSECFTAAKHWMDKTNAAEKALVAAVAALQRGRT